MNDRKTFVLKDYKVYCTNHPDGTCHAGAAVIVKNSIKHHLHRKFQEDYLQALTITVEDIQGNTNISSVYCPPRHSIKEEKFAEYFLTLGKRFVSGGD